MTGRRLRLSKLEAQRPGPQGLQVMIVQTIVDRGPDGEPVPIRVVRKEFTVYPAGAK